MESGISPLTSPPASAGFGGTGLPSDRIAILWRNADLASEVRDLIGRVRPFHHQWKVDVSDAAALGDFLGLLEAEVPYAVFAEVADFRDVAAYIDPLLATCMRAPVVIYGRGMENQAFLELHRSGVRFFLHLPAKPAEVESLFLELRAAPPAACPPTAPSGRILSFIPAKPGAGASTAAAHFAHAFAETLKKRVALVDLDLNCGVQGVLPQVESKLSLTEIVKRVHRTARIQIQSRLVGDHIYHPAGGHAALRNAMMRSMSPDDYYDALQWLYGGSGLAECSSAIR